MSGDSDQLPEDLDVTAVAGPYRFPEMTRRRNFGIVYMVVGVVAIGLWFGRHDGGVLVNDGFLAIGIVMIVLALYHFAATWRVTVDDKQALLAASRSVGFPVGHASAQLSWLGIRGRPTWRVLLFSAENPPSKRGIALVDALDGRVVEHFAEDNPDVEAV